MTRLEQKERERRFVDAMIEWLPLDIIAEPEQPDPPEPDVTLVLAGDHTVRVEIVEVIDEEIAASWDAMQERIREGIEAALIREGVNARLTCKLEMHSTRLLRKRELRRTADKIAKLAQEYVSTGLHGDKGPMRRHGIEHFRFINVDRAARPTVDFISKAPPQGPQAIQTAIAGKEDNLAVYRRFAADEHWLLVVGGELFSGYVTVEDAQNQAFESCFDRTVFLDRAARRCICLETLSPEHRPLSKPGG